MKQNLNLRKVNRNTQNSFMGMTYFIRSNQYAQSLIVHIKVLTVVAFYHNDLVFYV